MTAKLLDVTAARVHFPALRQKHQIYFDNAGGSQVLSTVASSVRNYLEETNVQLGASYNVAQQSTDIQEKGLGAAAEFIGAEPDEVVIGSSTTQLFSNLAQILPHFPPGSEFVLSRLDHEANVAPWVRLASHNSNISIRWWPSDSDLHTLRTSTSSPPKQSDNATRTTNPLLTTENLLPLLTPHTKLVACTHTSNILGTLHDIRSIATLVHTKTPSAFLCVDGVALAPHRAVDVHALGVDFYAFSWYKVYGPHISILYASKSAQQTLGSLGHYFHGRETLEEKLGLAGASYELVASIPSIVEYFGADREERAEKWAQIAAHEEAIAEVLLSYLRSLGDSITIWGELLPDRTKRVPVISFTINRRRARKVVEEVEKESGGRFGIRWGHFYSKRLVDDVLRLDEQGVVRVSLVHYNTVEEVQEFVQVLAEILKERW